MNVVIMEDDGSLASDVDENTMVALLESSFSEQMGSEVTLENVASPPTLWPASAPVTGWTTPSP